METTPGGPPWEKKGVRVGEEEVLIEDEQTCADLTGQSCALEMLLRTAR